VAHNAPLVLDLAPEVKLLSVKVNGWVKKSERTENSIVLRGVPSEFEIVTENLVNTKDNTTGEGLYQDEEGLFVTQNEPESFRKILPYFDCPKVMAPFQTTVIGNKERFPVMLVGGNLLSREKKDGLSLISYSMPIPIPSYLFALVAGKLGCLEDKFVTMSGRTVDLRIYAPEKDVASGKCDHAMRSLKKAMKSDEEVYRYEYELDIYNIVATPYFNMGAMENKGLNIFNVKYVLVSPETGTDEDFERIEGVIAHEYFHNWTGNRITCKDWRELGTKESITVYRDDRFSEKYCGWGLRKMIDSVKVIRSRQFAQEASPIRHAVRPGEIKEPNNMYTVTVYEKGAEIYKTLEKGIIGYDGFVNGMKLYAKRHDGQATRIEDLMRAMEDANGVDLWQFRNWFTQSGTPTVEIVANYCEVSRRLFLKVKQSCTMAPDRTHMEPFDIPFAIGLIGPDGEMRSTTLRITKPEHTFVFMGVPYKPALSLNRNFAPVNVKYDYAEGELAQLMAHDTNLFARWDASQTYGAQVLLKLVEDVKAGRELVLDQAYIDAFGAVLREENIDKNLLAAMIQLPDETTLANMSDVVDPHAIHKAREFAKNTIADTYRSRFYELYYAHHQVKFDPESVANRSVANNALSYLSAGNSFSTIARTVFWQFESAKGMSNKYTALSIIAGHHKQNFVLFKRKALAAFYEQFKDDNNTVDKWFAVQASCSLTGTVEVVKELVEHPAFDWKNPNRVRSVFSWFSLGSLQFHTPEGYHLFADFLAEYAPKNDITSSRLVEPLTDWKRYVPELQVMMKAELLRLKEELQKVPVEKVKGTMEKIEKSLAQQ
jgi:aminopeptidase N